MAIRERIGRKKPFVVYWVNPATKKMESKSFETRAEAEKQNAFIKYQLKYEKEEFKPVESEPETKSPTSLEAILYLYLQARNFTLGNLERTLLAIKPILAKYGETEIDQVDKKLLLEIQKNWILTGNKGTTVKRKIGIFKAMLNWAYRNSLIEAVPIFPEMPKCENERFVPPSPEEVSKIYNAALPHIKRVIVLGFVFGLRVGPCEMLKLRWSDINFEQGVIRVPNAKKGNSDPWREIPIKSSVLEQLRQWHSEDMQENCEFVVNYKGKQVKQIRTGWLGALRRAGIDRHIRPYDLRHAFATEAIASGADYGTVAALMGHKSPMMVLRHYQHVKTKQKALVIENMPDIHIAETSICP